MTRLYRRRPEHLPGKQAIVIAACRPGWRVGLILAQEGERWIVTLGGYLGDHPPPGMTVACTEASALQECLAAGPHGIARRFFQRASKLIDIPWQIAVGSDLQHPAVAGKRTAQVHFVNSYLPKLFQAAQHDAVLATRFLSCQSADEFWDERSSEKSSRDQLAVD